MAVEKINGEDVLTRDSFFHLAGFYVTNAPSGELDRIAHAQDICGREAIRGGAIAEPTSAVPSPADDGVILASGAGVKLACGELDSVAQAHDRRG